MTIVCTDGKTMAADGLGTTDAGLVVERAATKMLMLESGAVVGFAGDAAAIPGIVDWLNGGRSGPKPKAECSLLILHPDGKVERCGGALDPTVADPPTAIGVGQDFAIGAMRRGASPKEAVEIAAECNVFCGGKVTVLKPKRKP